MKTLALALAGFVLLLVSTGAQAQQRVVPCTPVTTTQASGFVTQGCVDATLSTPTGVEPIYRYVSAGSDQMALSVTTNTTLTVPSGATLAQICVEGAAIRYRDAGSAATTTLGIPVSSGSCFAYSGPLAALSFTAQSGSPTIDVAYYKAN